MTVQISQLEIAVAVLSVVVPVVLKLAEVVAQLALLHLPTAQQAQVRGAVAEVVAAVEQANAALPGAQKKLIAEQLLAILLRQRGLHLSPEQTDVLIEAAVHALNLTKAQIQAPLLPAVAVATSV